MLLLVDTCCRCTFPCDECEGLEGEEVVEEEVEDEVWWALLSSSDVAELKNAGGDHLRVLRFGDEEGFFSSDRL